MNTFNILLVDDHELVRQGLVTLLEDQSGIKVVGQASNGIEALEKTKELHPDLAILDINMDEMDGFETAKKLRQTHPLIKILLLSMHNSKDYIQKAIEINCDGYVVKSSHSSEIIDAINEIKKGNNYFEAKVSNIMLTSFFRKDDPQSRKSALSEREIEVVKHLAEGMLYREIGDQLNISPRTVESHRNNILKKLKLKSTADIIKYAIKNEFVSL